MKNKTHQPDQEQRKHANKKSKNQEEATKSHDKIHKKV